MRWLGIAALVFASACSGDKGDSERRTKPAQSTPQPRDVTRPPATKTPPAKKRTAPAEHWRTPFKLVQLPVLPPSPGSHKLGFKMTDKQYLESMPAQARAVPLGLLEATFFFANEADWNKALNDPRSVTKAKDVLSVRARETSQDGRYVPRKFRYLRTGDWDRWYLFDATRFLRAGMSVHRKTKKTYFYQVRRRRKADGTPEYFLSAVENCYSCHPTGLRKIIVRDDDPEADRALLKTFNQRIADTGLSSFDGAVDRKQLGDHLVECSECHNNKKRGRLHTVHMQAIRFKLNTLKSMPPDEPASAKDAAAILVGLCRPVVGNVWKLTGRPHNEAHLAAAARQCSVKSTSEELDCLRRATTLAELKACH